MAGTKFIQISTVTVYEGTVHIFALDEAGNVWQRIWEGWEEENRPNVDHSDRIWHKFPMKKEK